MLCQGIVFLALADVVRAEAPARMTIQRGPLESALTQLARQAGWQILFDPAIMRGLSTDGLQSYGSPREALRRLLEGSGLDVRWLSRNTLMVMRGGHRERTTASESSVEGQPIIVTALKWETVISETPVSMSVERGASLSAAGLKDVRAIARRHPELTVFESSSGQQRLTIRGIAGSGEPTVGVYYDETAVSGPGGTTFDPGAMSPDLDLVDIDRMELLHGPQGTLYGASAMGGVVRVIFNRPDPATWSGEVQLGVEQTVGGSLGGGASLVLNAPLVRDRLAARLSIYDRQVRGFIDNIRLNLKDVDQARKAGGRLAVTWLPDVDTSVLASATVQRAHIDNATFWFLDQGQYNNNQSTRTPQRNDLQLYNITVRHDFADVSTLLTVSRYVWHIERQIDYSVILANQKENPGACQSYFLLSGDTPCSGEQHQQFASLVDSRLPGVLYQPMDVNNWTAEIRISSDSGASSRWTVGVYFERRRENIRSYAVLADAKTGMILWPLDITGLRLLDSTLSQQALFGEWTEPLVKSVALTIGGRLFRYRRQSGGNVDIPNPITGTAALEQGRYSNSETGRNLKILLSYQPSHDLLAYAQASQGFRPGGVNITPILARELRNYGADRLWSYELGVKARAFGGRLSVNADIYRIDWTDMISPVSTANGAFSYNTNVGGVTIHGIEAEAVVAPDRKTTIEARTNLLVSRLKDDQLINTSGLVAHEGDRLPNVPDFTFAFALQRREPLSSKIDVVARLDFSFVGSMISGFNRTDIFFERTPSRSQTDLELQFEGGSWNAGIAVRNLQNSQSPVRILSNSSGRGQVYGSLPRTVSVNLGYRF